MNNDSPKTFGKLAGTGVHLFNLIAIVCLSVAHAQERPNILFCISDDQSYAHTGANGDPVVRTPGFDRIAQEGLRFTHAFCDAAFIAMERHDGCRKGGKGYPCRAIRTAEFLYIHNFEPTRWPSGSPDPSVCARSIPFGEIDSSPTKTFLMEHRNEHGVARLAELAFGMRPAEELYDLKTDPHQMVNLAGSIRMAETQAALRKRLFDHLGSTGDPRVGGPAEWDYYPYYGQISTRGWAVDPKPDRNEPK